MNFNALYIEIHNANNTACSLDGFGTSTNAGSLNAIANPIGNVVLEPNEYYLISGEISGCNQPGGCWIYLGNSEESWSDTTLSGTDLTTNFYADGSKCIAYEGTPGSENSVCQILGCTDTTACNYDEEANTDDGSCILLEPDGCTDSTACNYDVNATCDDGSCVYASGCDSCYGTNDGTGYVLDGDLDNDGICDEFEIYGCDNTEACNYYTFATENDGSCTFPGGDCELEGGIMGIYNDLCECVENNVSIIENHDKKELLHIINIIGQSTSNRTMNLYIYDDGSVEKKILAKIIFIHTHTYFDSFFTLETIL